MKPSIDTSREIKRVVESSRANGERNRKQGSSNDKRGQLRDAVSIDERPEVVDQRSRIGGWQIDTVICDNHKQVIVPS